MIALLPPSGSVLTERDPSAINPEKKKCGKQGQMNDADWGGSSEHSYLFNVQAALYGQNPKVRNCFFFRFFFCHGKRRALCALGPGPPHRP